MGKRAMKSEFARFMALLGASALCISCGAGPQESTEAQEVADAEKTGAQGGDNAAIAAPPDVAAPPASAVITRSGVRSVVLQKGKRLRQPAAHDRVEVHLTGWTLDGTMFETTATQDEPLSRAVMDGPPGLSEALRLMTQGEKRRVWIPRELAYSNQVGRPEGAVVYDIELIRIHDGVPPLPPPADLAAPSSDVLETPSGLTYRMLARKDTPGLPPRAEDRVELHYTSWRPDGEVFDSSVARGVPAKLAMKDLMPGWAEGLQLMREGDRMRLWIPEELTRNDTADPAEQPGDMLVMDIELLEVHRSDH